MASFFAGKRYLITGATHGIGRVLAKELSKAGGEVYAVGRTKELLDSLAKEATLIKPVVLDLSDWDLTRKTLKELDCFDGVVNGAAIPPQDTGFIPALECPKEWFESAFNVNVMAAINIIQSTGQKMVERGKGGSIVNISSVLGIYPCKMFGFHNISKAALDMVTKQFALELGPHQIRVNSVNPTLASTPNNVALPNYTELSDITKKLTPLKRICTTEEIIKPIMYFLSDDASMVTSSIHVVDGVRAKGTSRQRSGKGAIRRRFPLQSILPLDI